MILPLRKTYTHILCLGIACCTLSSAMAQKEDQTLKEKYRKEITSFFDQRLKDDTITFSTAIRHPYEMERNRRHEAGCMATMEGIQ